MAGKVKPIDLVLKSLYESISFKKGDRPDLQQLKNLFVNEARLIRTAKDNHEIMSVDDFINNFNTQLDAGAFIEFREYEIKRKIDMFGAIAHVFSTYQTEYETPGGKSETKGINSIQLIEVSDDWKVINIFWYNEDGENKIPPEYLP